MRIKNMVLIIVCTCLLIMSAVSASDYYQENNVSPQINIVNQNTNPVNVNVNVNSPKTTKVSKKTTITKNTQITKIYAPTKIFNIKTNIKKYSITLKSNNKPIQKQKIILKIKGKTYTTKTTNNGKATFKITNLKKKGTYIGTITYAGNNNYKPITKKIKIIIK